MQDTKEKIEKLLIDSPFDLHYINNINYKPHPYMITPSHLANSAGMYLDVEGAEKKGSTCGMKGCTLPYDQHTSDKVAALILNRNTTNDEANKVLKNVVDNIEENEIDGFIFIESKFKIEE